MGRNKMIAKSCPKCEMQVAVASKSCKCGHTFFASRRAADNLPAVEDIRRRTARVRRRQTQFYDGQNYQKQKRRSNKKRSHSNSLDEDYKHKDNKSESATVRARRRRALRRAQQKPTPQSERQRDSTPLLIPAQAFMGYSDPFFGDQNTFEAAETPHADLPSKSVKSAVSRNMRKNKKNVNHLMKNQKSFVIRKTSNGRRVFKIIVTDLTTIRKETSNESEDEDDKSEVCVQYVVTEAVDDVMDMTENLINKISKKLANEIA